ncbi:hypothetical protein BTN50_1087 [Candidatus Enterovibrio altilux]|uniref:Uncharacterized protein n=1 Tax=Candidatus Enterovibrio altilux TaxID=1927128 RepID=A0A291B9A2_9GAMM|nr:hypothetical protein BTN50_1087 [Candidatus Enterovibrio luxaltus]
MLLLRDFHVPPSNIFTQIITMINKNIYNNYILFYYAYLNRITNGN